MTEKRETDKKCTTEEKQEEQQEEKGRFIKTIIRFTLSKTL